MKRVAVTGGGGQIAYSLLFRIASGEVFGRGEKIALHLLEIPEALNALQGVVMELEDCAYPLLQEIKIGSDPMEVFEGIDVAFLVGAKPRTKGMERKELLAENGKIFVPQGKALNAVASKDVTVLVVGNPCNTNCLITMHNAPDIPRENFFAMTRLDQNRAKAQLALKSGLPVSEVSQMTIWGNHSATQVPDFVNAKIGERPAMEVISDHSYLKGEFLTCIQKRGAAIIDARGKSSAASAANAAIDSMQSILGTDSHFSAGIYSAGNPYGIDEDLIFSFPLKSSDGQIFTLSGIEWDDFLKEKIAATEKELIEERESIKELL